MKTSSTVVAASAMSARGCAAEPALAGILRVDGARDVAATADALVAAGH